MTSSTFDPTPFRPRELRRDDPAVDLRARQIMAMSVGMHPLAVVVEPGLKLHPDAPVTSDGDPHRLLGRRCRNCVHMIERKCTLGWSPEEGGTAVESRTAHRATASATTNVAAWWPGCDDHEHAGDALIRDGGPEEHAVAADWFARDRVNPPVPLPWPDRRAA